MVEYISPTMCQNNSSGIQPGDGLEGEDRNSHMDKQSRPEIDPDKVEKAKAELKVLKEYLKKQQVPKKNVNQRGNEG